MKRSSRWMVAGLALASLLAAGCIITSAQVLAHFDLPNPVHLNGSDDWEKVPVDLAVDVGSDYTDNKDKLEGVTDLAVLGTFTNTGNNSGQVSVYITADNTNYGSAAEVTANATLLWGAVSIGPAGSPDETVTIDWDTSAALFTAAGKQILIDEAKGDGQFTIYTVGTASATGYDIQITDGKVVLVLDAGL